MMILTRAETNTLSDAYDSYREYRLANTNVAINFIRQCSIILFHTLIMLTNFINLIETNY